MFFRSIAAALLVSQASAGSAIRPGRGGISADSEVGKKLLSKARLLNQNQDKDVTWAVSYSIKFNSCHDLVQVAAEEGGGGEDGNMLYMQHLVTFDLCPTYECKDGVQGCKYGAQYVVNMMDFVDAYTESHLEAQEWACEQIRENCYCDNANDDEVCENQCYVNAGMEECIEVQDENEEEFEIQRYLECAELEGQNGGNDNNNNNGQYYDNNGDIDYYRQYYVGPYCSNDGKRIHLGTFLDEGCSVLAKSGTYEALNYYGKSLPYSGSSESLVAHDCVSCEEVDQDQNNNNNNNNNGDNNNGNNNNNNNNNNGDVNVIAFCEEMYERSGKCEENVDIYYPDTTACKYIHDILPRLVKASKSISSGSSGGGNTAAVVFAWLFAFCTLGLGIYCFLLIRKMRRSKLDLSSSDGQVA